MKIIVFLVVFLFHNALVHAHGAKKAELENILMAIGRDVGKDLRPIKDLIIARSDFPDKLKAAFEELEKNIDYLERAIFSPQEKKNEEDFKVILGNIHDALTKLDEIEKKRIAGDLFNIALQDMRVKIGENDEKLQKFLELEKEYSDFSKNLSSLMLIKIPGVKDKEGLIALAPDFQYFSDFFLENW